MDADARGGAPVISMGPVLDFMRLFWTLDHCMQLASRGLEERLGLTEPQRLVVWLVSERPGISVGEVAEHQRWHSATVTGIAQRLERRGILKRRTDGVDRRRKLLYLTPKGKRFVQKDAVTIDHAVEKALRSVPPEAVAAAETILASVTREIDREHQD